MIALETSSGRTATAAPEDALAHSQPWLRAIRDEAELDAVRAAARADGHNTVLPSHVIEKGGQIIGYASIARLPVAYIWMHTQKANARDSMAVLNMVENEAARMGAPMLCVPCTENSPYHAVLPRWGYSALQRATMFVKKLRG